VTSHDGCTLDLVNEVGRQFTDVMFGVTNQLQQLRLTDNETFLLKAYVIFAGNQRVISIVLYIVFYHTVYTCSVVG